MDDRHSRKPLLAVELDGSGPGYGGTIEESGARLVDRAAFGSSVVTDSPPIPAAAALGTPAWDATAGDETRRPIILIVGPRQSGKSSIHNVVFHKLSPHETMYLGSTMNVAPELIAHNELFEFEVWDMPGDHAMHEAVQLEDGSSVPTEDVLRRCGALIFVVDAGEGVDAETAELLRNLGRRVLAHAHDLTVDVFVHKLDGDGIQGPDARMETQALAQMEASRVLRDAGLGALPVTFHATSVFDSSVHESVSRVVQRLLPQREPLQRLLDSFLPMCSLRAAGVYDVVSKLFVAKDTLGDAEALSGLIGDVLDLVVDVSCVYGTEWKEAATEGADASGSSASASSASSASSSTAAAGGADVHRAEEDGELFEEDEEGYEEDTFQFDDHSESSVMLQSGDVLVMRAVGPYLALVAVANADDFPAGSVQGAFDTNVNVLRNAIKALFKRSPGVDTFTLPPPADNPLGSRSVVSAAGSINA